MSKSIEPNIAELANGWMKSYGLPYKLEQEPLSEKISIFFREYQFKFIINGKQMNTFALYNFLKR
jgi:hypothetical protein|tara:strand:+ start:98 stop:292 length:195 start_codon:yes stop_codon:yes gene_type:complete